MNRRVRARLEQLRPRRPARSRWLIPPRWFVTRLEPAALPWPATQVWQGALVGGASVVTLALLLGGWVAAAAFATALVVAARVALGAAGGRAGVQFDRALPDLLEAVARGVRAGASLQLALAEAVRDAPLVVRRSFDVVRARIDAGVPFVDAVDEWGAAAPGEGPALAAAALALAGEVGGTASRSLDGVAATLRDRNAVRAEVRALSSQARASALVIGVAPVGFTVVASAVDPTTADFLLRRPIGVACLVGGLALDAVGVRWMHRLADVT